MFSKPSACFALLLLLVPAPLVAQVSSSNALTAPATAPTQSLVERALKSDPWEYGPFVNGGIGTGDRDNYTFISTGIHLGKLIGSPFGPGLLRGEFEMSGDLMPWWQGRTPNFLRYNTEVVNGKTIFIGPFPTGGAYNGVSITPITFRFNFLGQHPSDTRRLLPFIQGAGGLVWTNHKYPPVGPYQEPNKQGTSVWNFTPQFGIGLHYFLKPNQSLTFQANAVHISSASLGDTNPGVNASVQFTVGYTFWNVRLPIDFATHWARHGR